MRLFLVLVLTALLTTATVADEPDFDFKSNKAKAAVQKYQDASRKSNKRNLDSLIRSLEAAFKHERTEGDFEEAIKIRDAIKSLKNGDGLSSGSTLTQRAKVRIPRGAVKYEGHHYLLVPQHLSAQGAMTWCSLAGGHLMRVESKGEHAFARKLCSSVIDKNCMIWIDGTDALREGEWRFSNGQLMTYRGWANREPNGGTKENNIVLWPIGGLDFGNYADYGNSDFKTRMLFICEWDE